jgi:cytochrome c-type biogenesis protein CcsB
MTGFFDTMQAQGPLFMGAAGMFPVAAGAYGVATLKRGGAGMRMAASLLFYVAFALATALMAALWIEADRPPFKSLHESLLLFAWCVALVYIVIERFYRIAWLGAASALFATGLYIYAITKVDIEVVNLPAALQSPWFVPHVVVYFIGYGALFFAFIAAAVYLWKPTAQITLFTPGGEERKMSYGGFMHLAILLGFVMLTGGLLMGALWAKAAWGDYWVWDPKENWALISWLVFLIYLHLRRTRAYTDRVGAWLTVIGFIAIVFTYLGMHLLPNAEQSAHVYQ